MSSRIRTSAEVVGADVLSEVDDPCVFWVVDGTPATVRAALPGRRVRFVTPTVGDRLRRRGPSVAILVDSVTLASEQLAQLLPVRVVPMWVGGAWTGGPVRVRFGRPLAPAEGEDAATFGDRVADAGEALAAEEQHGWWQVVSGSVDLHDATVPSPPAGGWRQHWLRTDPHHGGDADRRAIWS
ncbi:hypothetical protein ACQBAU_09030 [Propionibacteriaceae bacterium Y2011]|uniref:hypothetical protein n=1 Tax=Microlunatus sp. Y2014 TaxID=3418488 RepID=UPI003B48F111